MDASVPKQRMTADEFIAWSMDQPKGPRYELCHGEIVGMASERAYHVRVKGRVFRRLEDAAEAAGLKCDTFTDGMSVKIDEDVVYEPDAALRLGPSLDNDVTSYSDPLIVVEVLSPSTQNLDTGLKLLDYFKLPSLRHYLIIRIDMPRVIHHRRDDAGVITTRIVKSGTIELDPPGLRLEFASLFP